MTTGPDKLKLFITSNEAVNGEKRKPIEWENLHFVCTDIGIYLRDG